MNHFRRREDDFDLASIMSADDFLRSVAEDIFMPFAQLLSDLPMAGASHMSGNGRVITMYHGTTRANAQSILANGFYQSSKGMLGRGVYLSTELEKAKRYPIHHPAFDKVVIKVKVNVGKVIAINRQGHPLQKTWHDHGYDTAWVPPGCGMVKSGLEEDCVWDPDRITVLEVIDLNSEEDEDEDEGDSDNDSDAYDNECDDADESDVNVYDDNEDDDDDDDEDDEDEDEAQTSSEEEEEQPKDECVIL